MIKPVRGAPNYWGLGRTRSDTLDEERAWLTARPRVLVAHAQAAQASCRRGLAPSSRGRAWLCSGRPRRRPRPRCVFAQDTARARGRPQGHQAAAVASVRHTRPFKGTCRGSNCIRHVTERSTYSESSQMLVNILRIIFMRKIPE